MQKFFENKLAFAAIVVLFALAMVCNATIGTSRSNLGDRGMNSTHANGIVQRGPNVPPAPWDWAKAA
jgi:hypothetical protein